MKVDIICPIYRGGSYVASLVDNIAKQKTKDNFSLKFILTVKDDVDGEDSEATNDCRREIKKAMRKYDWISLDTEKKADFSHSTTREKAMMASTAKIIVLITQDIDIRSDIWLEELVKDIREGIKKHKTAEKGDIVLTYSRQISKYKNIEKYSRERNYPEEDHVRGKRDIKKYGIKTFYTSDASSGFRADVFKKLGGYDGKKLPLSEDMYYAYKVIMNNYKIKYTSKSEVWHSHNFTLKETYNRYKMTGQFFAMNDYLNEYNSNKYGWDLAKYILRRAFSEHAVSAIFKWLPDMSARYLGMQVGKRKKNAK